VNNKEYLENISVADYLVIKDDLTRRLSKKADLFKLLQELKEHPAAQERLSFELLKQIRHNINANLSPRGLILDALQFGDSISLEKMGELLTELEGIIFECFQPLAELASIPGDKLALELTAGVALIGLRKRNRARFDQVCAALRRDLKLKKGDPREAILSRAARKRSQGFGPEK
jgi:hypothetical protein